MNRICTCGRAATRAVLIDRHLPLNHSQFGACDRCAERHATTALLRPEVISVETRPIHEEATR